MSNLRERAEEAFKIAKKRAQELMVERQIEMDKKNAAKLKKELEMVFGEKISPHSNEAIIDGIKFSMHDGFLMASIECQKCKMPAERNISSVLDLGALLNDPESYHQCPQFVEQVREEMIMEMSEQEAVGDSNESVIAEKPKSLWHKIVGGK